jgi:CheY-like chemotaxis protein
MNAPSRRERILLVEDDRAAADVLVFLLRGEEYDVTHAVDGRSALQLARSRRPDVVLLDLELPILNGRDFLLALRADPALADIPVVIVSGSDDVPLEGADAIVRKPLVKAQLLSVLEHVYKFASPGATSPAASSEQSRSSARTAAAGARPR